MLHKNGKEELKGFITRGLNKEQVSIIMYHFLRFIHDCMYYIILINLARLSDNKILQKQKYLCTIAILEPGIGYLFIIIIIIVIIIIEIILIIILL